MSGTSNKSRQSGGRTTLLGLLLIGILLLAIVILLNLRQTLLNSPTATPTFSPDVARRWPRGCQALATAFRGRRARASDQTFQSTRIAPAT